MSIYTRHNGAWHEVKPAVEPAFSLPDVTEEGEVLTTTTDSYGWAPLAAYTKEESDAKYATEEYVDNAVVGGAQWQDWTVDWLSTFTPGTSIITSRFLQDGGTVHAFADVTLQTGWSFDQPLMCAPPVTPKSNAAARAVIGNVNLMLNAVGYPMEGTFHRTNCNTTRMWIGRLAVNGGNLQVTDISQTQPGAWADNDNFRFSMVYEA